MMFLKSLKSSVRSLVKNKVFSSIGIVGFAAGFSVCLIIGMYVYNELTTDGFHEKQNRIFRLVDAESNSCDIDYMLKEKFEASYPGIERVCPVEISSSNYQVSSDENIAFVDGMISTTNDFFEVFSVDPVAALSEKPFADKHSAVITESAAKKIFGDVNPLGRSIVIDTDESIVSALIPDFPINSSIQGQILRNAVNENFRMNTTVLLKEDGVIRYNPTNHFLLLENNQNYLETEKRINSSIAEFNLQVDSIYLQPLKSIYFNSSIPDNNLHGKIAFVKILAIIAILILLLSVINYINYIISSQLKKHKEIGIKKTIGAKPIHLLTNYFTDILLSIIISLFISLIIVALAMPYLNNIFQLNLHLGNQLSLPFILVGLFTMMLIICFSLIPYVFMLSKFQILRFLKGNNIKIGKDKAGSLLTTFQLTISILLIAGLLIIHKQISYIKFSDLGFNDKELLYVEMPPYHSTFEYESFRNELLRSPFIEKASLSAGVPGSVSARMMHPEWKNIFYMIDVDEQFIPTMGMELKEGRNFTPADSSKNLIVVNEAALAAINEIDTSGVVAENFGEIVGVVKNFNFESLHQRIQPMVLKYGSGRSLSLKIATEDLSGVMDYINTVWADFYTNEPIQYKFYDTWFDSMYKKEEQISHASMIFSIVAIIITCLGLLGKVIQDSLSRTKEIGIRKVNGANVSEILALLNKDFIKWVAIAFVIATPIAYYVMNKWLENFAYKTTLSWWIFALAGLLALGIALLTVSWQSWRAATRNPVEALRYE